MQIFNGVLAVLLLAAFFAGQKRKRKEEQEQSYEKKMEEYFSRVAASYGKCGSMKEALEDAQTQNYFEMERDNHFLNMFLALCKTVELAGDVKEKGVSLFEKNLQYIKMELREHLLLFQRKKMLFLGLEPLCLIPFFLIPVIRFWAIHISESMLVFYDGSYGLVTSLLGFLGALFSYLFIIWLMYPKGKQQSRKWNFLVEPFLLKKWVSSYIAAHYSKSVKKNEMLKQVQGVGNIQEFYMQKVRYGLLGLGGAVLFFCCYTMTLKIQIANEVQIPKAYTLTMGEQEIIQGNEALKGLFEQIKNRPQETAAPMVSSFFQKDPWKCYSIEFTGAAQDLVLEKTAKYQESGFSVWYVFFTLAAGIMAFMLPELIMFLGRWEQQERRMEESLRLQTVVLMVIHYEQTTVEEILELMEQFSELFSPILERTVDMFSYDRWMAIRCFREGVSDEPLERICDSLEACDEISVRQAFLDLEGEREYFLRKNSGDRFDFLKEKAALAKVIAYVPFGIILLGKLLIPFVAEGLLELQMYGMM